MAIHCFNINIFYGKLKIENYSMQLVSNVWKLFDITWAFPKWLILLLLLFLLLSFSHSVMSDSLWPHGLQYSRFPFPSPSLRAYSNSFQLSQWCHPTILSSVISFSSCLQSFPASIFSNESALRIRWPKYWNFSLSISPSNEYSGMISFRIDWFDLFAVQGTLKSLLKHHSSKASILWHSAFFWSNSHIHTWLLEKP